MKKLILAVSLMLSASLTFMSCNNGVYDANPDTNNTGAPPNGGGGGGGSFTWTGTDPVSGKVDGVAFQCTSGAAIDFFGYLNVNGFGAAAGDISLIMPSTITVGGVYNFSTVTNGTFNAGTSSSDIYSGNTAQGGSGAIKILENDATHVKGLFYGTFKNSAGAAKVITDGYFNVLK